MKEIPGFVKGSIIQLIQPDAKTIEDLIKDFYHAAFIHGMRDIHVDQDILWFSDMDISKTDYTTKYSRIMRCIMPLTHSMISNRCVTAGHYREYTLAESIRFATIMVMNGEIMKCNNTGVVMYLKNGQIERNAFRHMVYVFREETGVLSLITTSVENNGYLAKDDGVLCMMLKKH